MAAIRVVCAVLGDGGLFLAARRRLGLARAGLWEFPGGKVEAGEGEEEALLRELDEEFGARAAGLRRMGSALHDYGDLSIELCAWEGRMERGISRMTDHDALAWLEPSALALLPFAPADVPFRDALSARGPSRPGT